jgi:glycerophosphoryl diester phosphodiesterase
MHPYLALPTPHLFGHRGASGEAPENTIVAFERAWKQGVPFLETDCHATKDGEIVACHDAAVERTTDGSGEIRTLRMTELERLDAGYRFSPDGRTHPFRGRGVRIPRLADLLAAFPEARFNLEIKQAEPPIAEQVVELIAKLGALDRVLLAADEPEILEHVRSLRAGTALGMSRADALEFFRAVHEGRMDAYRAPGHALQIPPEFMGQPLVTPQVMAAAHRAGLVVHVWTVNDPARMAVLLASGVDGLMSDFPARLVEAAHRAAP